MRDTETRLSPEEKVFAEKNIGILFAFMRRYHLPEDYFGALAIAYVRFVWKYLNNKEKYACSFSTLMWQRLRSALSHIERKENSAQTMIPFRDWDEVIGQEDSYFEQDVINEMIRHLIPKQIEIVLLRIEGYTNAQIASIKGVTERAIERQFSRIRRVYKGRYKHN